MLKKQSNKEEQKEEVLSRLCPFAPTQPAHVALNVRAV